MHYYDFYQSPHGEMLLLTEDEALCGVYFAGQKYFPRIDPEWRGHVQHETLQQVWQQLADYYAGIRRQFDIALAPRGTPFQRAIWKAIAAVRFGETISYSELARRAGYAGSARAAGAATGRNPISVIVPCHRILGSNGSLTGYAGGLERKRALLALESGNTDLLAAA